MAVGVLRCAQLSAGRADRPTVDSSDSLLSLLALSLAMSAIACAKPLVHGFTWQEFCCLTHDNSLLLLLYQVSPIYAPSHVRHDDVPAAAIDEDHVAQAWEPCFVLAVEGCQFLCLFLGPSLQLGLLGGALAAVHLLRAQPRMGS